MLKSHPTFNSQRKNKTGALSVIGEESACKGLDQGFL